MQRSWGVTKQGTFTEFDKSSVAGTESRKNEPEVGSGSDVQSSYLR